MKVRIEDKEALEALSWESLKAYLDRSEDWTYAEDIPGKAAVYQHSDSNGRLWEIIVPLRRNLGDYVSRMADAVSTLARVEDRSELDVYDDLANSPAETAHKVHKRIRAWIEEENWEVHDIPNPNAKFNIVVTLHNGQGLRIFQSIFDVDHITIAKQLVLGGNILEDFSHISPQSQRDILRGLQRDATLAGVDVEGLERPLQAVWFFSYAYFDGLTKDVLIQRSLLVLRALALSVNTLIQGFERAERPDVAAHLDGLVPRGTLGDGRSLTAAG